MIIGQPYCDWVALPFGDKRKGFFWMCKECRHMGKGKTVPKCPCKPIEIDQPTPRT